MDYSILVGIDEAKGEIVIGIIDYVSPDAGSLCEESLVVHVRVPTPTLDQIRRYDLVKEVEFRVKNLTQHEPTVVSPNRYCDAALGFSGHPNVTPRPCPCVPRPQVSR